MKNEMYTIFGVGGKRDGEEIAQTPSLGEAVNIANEHESEFPLGTSIIDQDGKCWDF